MSKTKLWGGLGWVGGVVAHVIIVSAQGPNPSFFSFLGGLLFDLGAFWDSDLDQGLTITYYIRTKAKKTDRQQNNDVHGLVTKVKKNPDILK